MQRFIWVKEYFGVRCTLRCSVSDVKSWHCICRIASSGKPTVSSFLAPCLVMHASSKNATECKSIDPLYTSHEFPKRYVHIISNARVFFTILCSGHVWPSWFGLLYWHVITSDWKCWIIAGKIVSLLTNGGNVLTGACFNSGFRHECEMFAWMVFNGSVSNHALKEMEKKRTFHDVQ